MPAATVKIISAEALRWLLSQPSSEIGGLLWGTFEGDSVRIADAEFVFSEDSHFNDTPADARRLEEALTRSDKPELSLVGYFRSHIREGLLLSEQDRKLIEAHLRDPRSVFLLVRPFQMGISMAAFFFWENGRLQTEISDLEVPLVALDAGPARPSAEPASGEPLVSSEASSAGSGAAVAKAPAPALEVAAPSAAIEAAVPLTPEPPAPIAETPIRETPAVPVRNRFPLPALAAAVLLGIAAALLAYLSTGAFRHAPASSSVDLQVSRRADGQLDLTWNPNSRDAASARSGSVFIHDGELRRTIPLDAAQLHSGRIAYFPQSDDVQFRLELETAHNRTISESLHVFPPSPGTAQPRPVEAIASYQPPRPLHQVMPNVELLQPVGLAQGMQARVEVLVDSTGRVTSAEALKAGTTANESLVNSAVSAARQWTFSPATLDGKPIDARHTIVFQFDRSVH